MADAWSWEFNRNRPQTPATYAATEPRKDEYWERLIKAVPVQAVGFYTAGDSIAQSAGDSRTLALIAVFVAGLLFGVLEMVLQRKATAIEVVVALGAYLVWVYAQGGVFESLGWYVGTVGALLVLAYATAIQFVPKPTSA